MDQSDIPLSELKAKLESAAQKSDSKLVKEKPYFKCTSYELYKYKHNCIFKCMKCKKRESLEKDINNHYRSSQGKLRCDQCGGLFNTFSAF